MKKVQPKPKKLHDLPTKSQLCVVRFSPDGKLLAAGGTDSHVHRWNTSGEGVPAPLAPWDAGGGWVQALEFLPKSPRLITADSWGELAAWNASDPKPAPVWKIRDAHDGWIHALAISPDGSQIATAGIDGTVRLWSSDKGTKLREWKDHAGVEVFAVAFHPDGKSIVSGDLLGRVIERNLTASSPAPVREFDAKILHKTDRLQEVGGARNLAFTRDGGTLLVGGTIPSNGGNVQGKATILCFDWKSGKPGKKLNLAGSADIYIGEIVPHPDGYLMLPLSGNPGSGRLALMHLDDSQPFFTAALANCHSLALHPSKTRVAITSTNSGSNGNGRQLVKGEYVGNSSPVVLFEIKS